MLLADTPRQLERPDARRVVLGALLVVVPHVPDGAVVRGIDGGLRVVLPPQRVLLRPLTLGERGFLECQHARGIGGEAAGEALTGKGPVASVGVADRSEERRVGK